MTHLAAQTLRRLAQALRLAADLLEPPMLPDAIVYGVEPASMTIYTTNGTTNAARWTTHG